MSNHNQNNQRLRRNGSPSTKQGPIRATQQFALASPSRGPVRRSPTSSPGPKDSGKSRTRPLSETGLLTGGGRRSPSSPCGFRIIEKPKPIVAGRSTSFDNVMAAPYLSGQWPKDGQWQHQRDPIVHYLPSTCGPFTSDKQTQTPDEWDDTNDRRRSASKVSKSRSQSVGSGDQQLKNIKHKLQRNCGLPAWTTSYQQRLSPVFPASACVQMVGSTPSSTPIKIPISTSANGMLSAPRGTPSKARGSVEGLNQEVEKLIISGRKLDATESAVVDNIDGHRAPVYELLSQTRTVDTQTPSQTSLDCSSDPLPIMLEEASDAGTRSSSQGSDNSRCSSRDDEEDVSSQSVSPSFIPGQFELEDSGLLEQNVDEVEDLATKMPASPRLSNEFMRQPPDGAEKIKIIDELTIVPKFAGLRHLAPSKTFQPSATSAFQYLPVYRRSMESSCVPVEDAH